MERDERENPDLEQVVEEATDEAPRGQLAARREVERLEDDDGPSPQDGTQM